jgi:uncharacterized membrane protein YqgA involved in biofilm formation
MLGVLINTAAVILGSLLGLLSRKIISEKLTSAVMVGIGLVTISLGIAGVAAEGEMLVLAGSLVLGVITGTALDINGWLNRLGTKLAGKQTPGQKDNAAQAFVSASLIFCVGAMAIIGSLQAGLNNDNQILYTKSILDFFVSISLCVSMGWGVIYAAAAVFLYQGSLVLLSGLLQPVLTTMAITEISRAGSAILILLGLNMLKLGNCKVADLLPAIIFAPLLCLFFS